MKASLLQSERMGKTPKICFAKVLESLCGRQKKKGGEEVKLIWPCTSEVEKFTLILSIPTYWNQMCY